MDAFSILNIGKVAKPMMGDEIPISCPFNGLKCVATINISQTHGEVPYSYAGGEVYEWQNAIYYVGSISCNIDTLGTVNLDTGWDPNFNNAESKTIWNDTFTSFKFRNNGTTRFSGKSYGYSIYVNNGAPCLYSDRVWLDFSISYTAKTDGTIGCTLAMRADTKASANGPNKSPDSFSPTSINTTATCYFPTFEGITVTI